jgi:hypothetical protein
MLDDDELRSLLPAETSAFPSPIPTQFVSSDEFLPAPQTERQKQVEARIKALGSKLARHQGMTRRRFFETAAGMAAAFLVMNDVYGPLFDVSKAEAATPDMADERALADQLIMDMHTHFLRDDTRLEGFVRSRAAVGKAGWNPALAGKPLGPADGGEAHDLRRQLGAALQVRPARRARHGPHRARQGAVRGERRRTHQPALRLRRRTDGVGKAGEEGRTRRPPSARGSRPFFRRGWIDRGRGARRVASVPPERAGFEQHT